MENIQCSCGSMDKFLRKKGSATGLYCINCEKWFKWVGKKDLPIYKNRGFRVHEEGYSPKPLPSPPPQYQEHGQNFGSNIPETTQYTNPNDNVPEYLRQHARPLDLQTVPQPYLEDNFTEDPLPDDFDDEPVSNNLLRQGTMNHTYENDEPCRTCITGIIEPYGKKPVLSATITLGVLNIHNTDKTKLFGSFELKYCPSCGRKLD